MKKLFTILLPLSLTAGAADHVIFSKIVIKPTNAEMVAIYNPTNEPIDLSDYYITDATQYDILTPTADFSADINEGGTPLVVNFTDTSIPGTSTITSWNWNFGNGEISTDQNPTCMYTEVGVYNVTLTVSDYAGLQSTETKFDYIETYWGGPDFSVMVTVTGGETSYNLMVGFSPDATDGYDPGIDQYAPPAPPPPIFDAALAWNSERFYTQIVNGDTSDLAEHIWEIQLAYPSDNQITLTWDNTGWSDLMTSCLLQDAFGGLMIDVDMLTDNSLELTNPAFITLKLKVTPNNFSPSRAKLLTEMETESDSVDVYYYNLPLGEQYWSGSISDFIARFPENTIIEPGDTLLLSLHTREQFEEEYFFPPDISLFEDMRNATDDETVITISHGPVFSSIPVLDDSKEMLVMFFWDGLSSKVEDVDYFLWGDNSYAIDKTGVEGYNPDTPVEGQSFIYAHDEDSIYVRIGTEEIGENSTGGNGITGHDETSENLSESWEVIFSPHIIYGCLNESAANYNPNANTDDGKCFDLTIQQIYSQYEDAITVPCDEGLSENTTTMGLVVSYQDKSSSGGPKIITIEDDNGYQIDAVVWEWDPMSSETISQYVDYYNPTEYYVLIEGTLGVYNCSFQLDVASEDDLIYYSEYSPQGNFIQDTTIVKVKINPAPFVIIPSMGERLDYSYSFPDDSRVIVRIFDLGGRFVTTLVDSYFKDGGSVMRDTDNAEWDGRDHLGQVVSPGTYIMHIEANQFHSGKSFNDYAPVVVGVRLN